MYIELYTKVTKVSRRKWMFNIDSDLKIRLDEVSDFARETARHKWRRVGYWGWRPSDMRNLSHIAMARPLAEEASEVFHEARRRAVEEITFDTR